MVEAVVDKRIKVFESELAFIQDTRIKAIVIATLLKAPDYFWTIPASSTGKYHTAENNAEGGLIYHTKSAVRVGEELCRAYNILSGTLSYDIVIGALILHDICKLGYPTASKYTVRGHAYLVSNVMYDAGIKTEEMEIQWLLTVISRHMGTWDVPYVPLGNFGDEHKWSDEETIVHLADYIASRKFIHFDV